MSQVLIYVALGELPTGVAITIFFLYPVMTVLASWGLFGDRPTLIRWVALALIGIGILFSLPHFFDAVRVNLGLGVAAAVASGVSFAGYLLFTQICTQKLHPISFSLINFFIVFIFSVFGVFVAWKSNSWNMIVDAMGADLIFGGIWLGFLTLISYLLNNFAIHFASATQVSIVGSTGPSLTFLFAFLIIRDPITPQQLGGMILVTLGVVALGFERMLLGKKNLCRQIKG